MRQGKRGEKPVSFPQFSVRHQTVHLHHAASGSIAVYPHSVVSGRFVFICTVPYLIVSHPFALRCIWSCSIYPHRFVSVRSVFFRTVPYVIVPYSFAPCCVWQYSVHPHRAVSDRVVLVAPWFLPFSTLRLALRILTCRFQISFRFSSFMTGSATRHYRHSHSHSKKS